MNSFYIPTLLSIFVSTNASVVDDDELSKLTKKEAENEQSIVTNLTSVFSTCCLTPLYESARKRAPRLKTAPKSDARAHDTICQNILSSDYFANNNYVPSDVEDLYEDLAKEENRHIHDDLFEKVSDTRLESLFSIENSYVCTNRYHVLNGDTAIREVDQQEFRVEDEYIFTCVARDCITKGIEPFYITQEYNTLDSATGHHIAGRFVFRGDREKELVLVALAEEPAKVLYSDFDSQLRLERYYLDLKNEDPEDKWEDNGAFCEQVDRTRLCSSVFAGMASFPACENELFSTPYYKPMECFKKEVSFSTDEALEETKGSPKYYEWMVYCEAWENYHNLNSMVRFFVSGAYKPGQVFVYSAYDENEPVCLWDGKAYLKNLSTNIADSALWNKYDGERDGFSPPLLETKT